MVNFSIKGCRVSFSVGFFALITLMLITSEAQLVMQSLFCSVFHEAGHIIAMLAFGERLSCLEFSAFGIAIERPTVSSLNYSREVIVSLAGIISNIILALIVFALSSLLSLPSLKNIGYISLIVAAFNLLPTTPLDGARALYFALTARYGERQADAVLFALSLISTVLILFLAVVTLIYKSANFSLIFAAAYLSVLLISNLISHRTC